MATTGTTTAAAESSSRHTPGGIGDISAGRRPRSRLLATALTIFVAAVTAIAVLVVGDLSQATPEREDPGVITERLVNQGLIPPAALDTEPDETMLRSLVVRGLVPDEALEPARQDG